MSLIEWKAEFSVGVAAVDHEHRQLVELINNLHDLMRADGTHDRVIESLGEIYAQISAHFALEEKEMRHANYDQLGAHKADHEALLDALLDILDGVEADGSYDEQTLSSGLEAWFTNHFRTHDARLHNKLG